MSDILTKHRVIGIRHALKFLKNAGLIESNINYPEEAVIALTKSITAAEWKIWKAERKADTAKRHRGARKDAGITAFTRTIEDTFDLPTGSVCLIYPNGRKARSDATVGSLRKNWIKSHESKR